jgi:hypothetical protein
LVKNAPRADGHFGADNNHDPRKERQMAVDAVQSFTWGPLDNSTVNQQSNFFRIPVSGTPNILATSYLAEVSIGDQGTTAGVAVASFKRFEFLDGNGLVQETELSSISSAIFVERCVSITVAFDLIDAIACAGWTFYWLS